MSSAENKAVFLSYASQDTEAARHICEALRAAGVEVWLDQGGGLVGGDVWDAKIRAQIASCVLFVPVISANSQARREGYFRLEWKLAAQRTHMMSERTAFLLPVVIDTTRDADADVPAEFRAVQWTRLPGGETSAKFCVHVGQLLGGYDIGPVASRAPGQPLSPQPNRRTSRRWFLPMGLAAIVAISLGLWRPWFRPAAPPTGSPKPLGSDARSAESATARTIAVLPFANRSDDAGAEYFSDGLTEEILNALAADPTLQVAARTSSFAFKGKSTSIEDIGRALKVARIIEGSVRKDGARVRITVQLINATNGYQEWSQPFDAEMTNIFALQSEIAGRIAQRLRGASANGSTAKAPVAGTTNLEAFDLYLQARALQTAPRSATARLEIVKLYEAAVLKDPGYAMAWSRLAEEFVQSLTGGFDRSAEIAAKAAKAAATALKLAPQLPEALVAVANVRLNIDRDHEATERVLNELSRVAPNNAEAYMLRANLERDRGNWGESLVEFINRAVELDPQNAASLQRAATLLNSIGRFAGADRLARRSWEISQSGSQALRQLAINHVEWTGDAAGALALLNTAPETLRVSNLFLGVRARLRHLQGDIPGAIADLEQEKFMLRNRNLNLSTSGPRTGNVLVCFFLGRIEASRGRAAAAAMHFDEALQLARQYVADFPDLPHGTGNLARILASQGERSEALTAMQHSMELTQRTRDAMQIAGARRTVKAEVFALLGDKADAIAELQALHGLGYGFGFSLRLDPEWASLRNEPAFQQLMSEAEARAKAQPRSKT